jgi:hypothetical protein
MLCWGIGIGCATPFRATCGCTFGVLIGVDLEDFEKEADANVFPCRLAGALLYSCVRARFIAPSRIWLS